MTSSCEISLKLNYTRKTLADSSSFRVKDLAPGETVSDYVAQLIRHLHDYVFTSHELVHVSQNTDIATLATLLANEWA